MGSKNVLNDKDLKQVNGGTQGILPKDHYENIILNPPKQDKTLSQTYRKE